jgi:hypothetical protein
MWLNSILPTELILVILPALLGILAIMSRIRKGCEVEIRAATISLLFLSFHVALKSTYINSGTELCLAQAFVIDQMGIVALGFALYARRKSEGRNRTLIQIAILGASLSVLWTTVSYIRLALSYMM